jgi:hypothetical protein
MDRAKHFCYGQNWKEAEKALNETLNAASSDKEKIETLTLLHDVHNYSGCPDKAEEDIAKAFAIPTDDVALRINVLTRQSKILIAKNKKDEAKKLLEEIINTPAASENARNNAKQQLDVLAGKTGGSFKELMAKAQSYYYGQNWKEVEKALDETLKVAGTDKEKLDTLLLLYGYHSFSRQQDKTREDLKQIIALPTISDEARKDAQKKLDSLTN